MIIRTALPTNSEVSLRKKMTEPEFVAHIEDICESVCPGRTSPRLRFATASRVILTSLLANEKEPENAQIAPFKTYRAVTV
jgi:hypothetical protein